MPEFLSEAEWIVQPLRTRKVADSSTTGKKQKFGHFSSFLNIQIINESKWFSQLHVQVAQRLRTYVKLCKIYKMSWNLNKSLFLQGNQSFGLLLYACQGYEDLLEHTLINTSKINWSERPLLQGVLPRHYSLIHNVAKIKNFEAQLYVESTILILPIEQALNFETT